MSYEHKDRSGYFYTKQALGKGMKFKHLLMPLLFKIDIHLIYFGPRVYPRGSYVIIHVRPWLISALVRF